MQIFVLKFCPLVELVVEQEEVEEEEIIRRGKH